MALRSAWVLVFGLLCGCGGEAGSSCIGRSDERRHGRGRWNLEQWWHEFERRHGGHEGAGGAAGAAGGGGAAQADPPPMLGFGRQLLREPFGQR